LTIADQKHFEYIDFAIRIVGETLPCDMFDITSCQLHRRYQPHVLHCHELAEKYSIRTVSLAALLSKALNYMAERIPYHVSRRTAETALSIRSELLGEKTFETTQSMVQLSGLLQSWFYYGESEAMFLRAKAIRLAMFGVSHKYTLEVNVYLVALYQEIENHTEACRILNEELTEEIIPWKEMEDPDMRYVLCNNWHIRVNAKIVTAKFQKRQDTLQECTEEMAYVLKFYEEKFGTGHPYIAPVKCTIADLYSKIPVPNHSPQALRQYQQARKILEATAAPHIALGPIDICLALEYSSASRPRDAREALKSAAKEARKMLGEGKEIQFHSYILVLANLLSSLWGAADDNGRQSEYMVHDALSDFDEWQGARDDLLDHTSITYSGVALATIKVACRLRANLGKAQQQRGEFEDAVTSFNRVIHDVQGSASETVKKSGWSAIACIHLINLYTEAGNLTNIPDESQKYACQLAAELVDTEFEEWWTILAHAAPLLQIAGLSMSRGGVLAGNLSRLLLLAVERDAMLRRSGSNLDEAPVRQDIIQTLRNSVNLFNLLLR
jgi:tetratricopeptide (TPR) repeat protein